MNDLLEQYCIDLKIFPILCLFPEADISVALTKFKDENKDKHREIILVVKACVFRAGRSTLMSISLSQADEVLSARTA